MKQITEIIIIIIIIIRHQSGLEAPALASSNSLFKGLSSRLHIICIQTNKMHKILVIRLNFLLDALHVSDYISPSSGANL